MRSIKLSALLLSTWTLTSCAVEQPPQRSPVSRQPETETSASRKIETLLLDYDRGGQSREKALQSLKELGDVAIDALQQQVLPRNAPQVRLRAIAILAKLQHYSEESAETLALVMTTIGDWEFEERPLQEVCAELQRVSGISFRLKDSLDPKRKMSIKFREGRLNTMLHLLLRPHGLQFMIQGKEIWIY